MLPSAKVHAEAREREEAERRARELEGRVAEMSGEIEPLRVSVGELRAEVEVRGAHVKRLEEESARWQARNSQLLAKVCLVFGMC